MVKRLKALAEKQAAAAGGLFDHPLKNAVKDSAQQIWLAGMGAFAKAQAGGNKVFEALVRDGQSLQRKTQNAAEDRISEVTTKVTDMAGGLSGKATQHWDKLETIFEERVAKALNRLGVPSAKDVEALMARIDALSASVARLSGTAPKAATKAGARAAAPATPAKARAKVAAKAPAKAPAKEAAAKPAGKRSARQPAKA